MVETMRDVLGEAVEIRGGHYIGARAGSMRFYGGPESYHLGGGYVLGVGRYRTGTATVELAKVGHEQAIEMVGFDTVAEAEGEFGRIKAQLILRQQVEVVFDLLYVVTGVLPEEFVPSVRAGDFEALLIAADFQDDRGEGDKAVLLRSAYYRLSGQVNVAVKASKKVVLVLNPQQVTKRSPEGFDGGRGSLGNLAAAVVTVGESVRVVALNTNTYRPVAVEAREFKVGSQAEYDSFNLVYFAPVESITAKTVVIADRYGRGEKRRLTIGAFVAKNRDFDLAKAQKRNDEWMD